MSDEEKEQIVAVFSYCGSRRNSCIVKDIMAGYCNKWSMYAILMLGQHQKIRFNELRSGISGISQRMLTVTLRSLEKNGVVSRTMYPQIPPRVEYQLTPLGESLLKQLLQLAGWAEENFAEIMKAKKKYEKINA